MNKEQIIKKLTSRKWWLAVAAFVVAVVTMIKDSGTAEQIGALILLAADVVGYSLGEGLADSANNSTI